MHRGAQACVLIHRVCLQWFQQCAGTPMAGAADETLFDDFMRVVVEKYRAHTHRLATLLLRSRPCAVQRDAAAAEVEPLEALLTMLGEQQSGLREFLDGQRLKVLAEKVETERRVRLCLLGPACGYFSRANHWH